jgi:hypothetical protein
MSSSSSTAPASTINTPSPETMTFCFKLSLEDEKPIMTDYWTASLEKNAFIGVRGEGADKIQLLVKSEEEYTSPIKKIRKSGANYIVETENSIYIVSTDIQVKKIA